jgi:hypothetical protein
MPANARWFNGLGRKTLAAMPHYPDRKNASRSTIRPAS